MEKHRTAQENYAGLVGRAGRQANESEDLGRDSKRWQRRKATIERFIENVKAAPEKE